MPFAELKDVTLYYELDGPEEGPVVVFSNSLGTDLSLWDAVLPLLPPTVRILRYDMRGHGQSSCPPAPYSMGALVRDAAALLDHLAISDCAFVGLSIGGMIAQGLAIKRLDLVRVMVLSNTAAKIGLASMWDDRIAAVRRDGIASIADSVMERWFSRDYRSQTDISRWRDMLIAQPLEGYIGAMAAISGTDFYTPTSGLRLPTLAIAGSEDASTPPDLVRETADLIPGSKFHLIRRSGHLPCVDQPEAFASALGAFLRETGHI